MITTILTALISFCSTNIDDILVLMLLFSQIDSATKKIHIIIGQYLGIGLLTTISIIGSLGLSVIKSEYIGLLGLLPIYLGIKSYIDNKKEADDNDPIILQNPKDSSFNKKRGVLPSIKSRINPTIIKICGITLANGADNVGIYIPLFTGMDLKTIVLTVIIFTFLIALWCFIAINLAQTHLIKRIIEMYKHIFVPIIFIGLGFFILVENKTFNLALF